MRKPLKKNKDLQLKLWLMMPMGERIYYALVHYRNIKFFWQSDKAKELMKAYVDNQQRAK